MGHTVRRFIASLRLLTGKSTVLVGGPHEGTQGFRNKLLIEVITQIVFSVAILGATGYVLLGEEYDMSTREVMSGFAGSVVGYWFR